MSEVSSDQGLLVLIYISSFSALIASLFSAVQIKVCKLLLISSFLWVFNKVGRKLIDYMHFGALGWIVPRV